MGFRRRVIAARGRHAAEIGLALALLGLGACGRRSPAPGTHARGVASASAHDRLAPGEAPPGVESAFELTLPRGARVERRFENQVWVLAPMPPEELATWVRERAPKAEPLVGPRGTIFPSVTLPDMPAGTHLRITITTRSISATTTMLVERWQDPPPPHPEPRDEIMRKSGLTPDGKLLDPKHLD